MHKKARCMCDFNPQDLFPVPLLTMLICAHPQAVVVQLVVMPRLMWTSNFLFGQLATCPHIQDQWLARLITAEPSKDFRAVFSSTL